MGGGVTVYLDFILRPHLLDKTSKMAEIQTLRLHQRATDPCSCRRLRVVFDGGRPHPIPTTFSTISQDVFTLGVPLVDCGDKCFVLRRLYACV
jgi:hypothetical protein